ncbi:MAG: hypothetical protein U0174_10870 [Polyangiaceae bacterium]
MKTNALTFTLRRVRSSLRTDVNTGSRAQSGCSKSPSAYGNAASKICVKGTCGGTNVLPGGGCDLGSFAAESAV